MQSEVNSINMTWLKEEEQFCKYLEDPENAKKFVDELKPFSSTPQYLEGKIFIKGLNTDKFLGKVVNALGLQVGSSTIVLIESPFNDKEELEQCAFLYNLKYLVLDFGELAMRNEPFDPDRPSDFLPIIVYTGEEKLPFDTITSEIQIFRTVFHIIQANYSELVTPESGLGHFVDFCRYQREYYNDRKEFLESARTFMEGPEGPEFLSELFASNEMEQKEILVAMLAFRNQS